MIGDIAEANYTHPRAFVECLWGICHVQELKYHSCVVVVDPIKKREFVNQSLNCA